MIRRLATKHLNRCSRAVYCTFSEISNTVAIAGMSIRPSEKLEDLIKSQKNEYSNLLPSIENLTDRMIYKQEGHPLNTIARTYCCP